jgi:hypothetical protein
VLTPRRTGIRKPRIIRDPYGTSCAHGRHGCRGSDQRTSTGDSGWLPGKYLLEVNVLVALGLMEHSFYARVSTRTRDQAPSNDYSLLTCPITELGFVRVLSQAPQYGITVVQAKSLLRMLKKIGNFESRFHRGGS